MFLRALSLRNFTPGSVLRIVATMHWCVRIGRTRTTARMWAPSRRRTSSRHSGTGRRRTPAGMEPSRRRRNFETRASRPMGECPTWPRGSSWSDLAGDRRSIEFVGTALKVFVSFESLASPGPSQGSSGSVHCDGRTIRYRDWTAAGVIKDHLAGRQAHIPGANIRASQGYSGALRPSPQRHV